MSISAAPASVIVCGQIAAAEFAAKARAGHADDIRLCLSCNQECVGRMGLNRWLGEDLADADWRVHLLERGLLAGSFILRRTSRPPATWSATQTYADVGIGAVMPITRTKLTWATPGDSHRLRQRTQPLHPPALTVALTGNRHSPIALRTGPQRVLAMPRLPVLGEFPGARRNG